MRTHLRHRRALALVTIVALAVIASACDQQATTPTTLITPVVNTFIVQTSVVATTPTVTGALPITPPTTALPTTTASTSTTIAASTTNPDVASVTIARGEFLTNPAGSCTPTTCKRVAITTSGWKPREALVITCYSSLGTTGPYSKTADSQGRFSSSTLCFYGNAKNVYVVVNDVTSNVITPWKDW